MQPPLKSVHANDCSRLIGVADQFKAVQDADRFEVLLALTGAYEQKHWAIKAPDAITAIREVMAQRNYTQSDLAALLGSRSRASEILNRKRPITPEQTRLLHECWEVPAEALLAG